MILFFISFIAGVLTVLAPCILPLLPVIVGGSLSNGGGSGFNKKKAFTIILSLGVSVIAFTLLLKASTLFIEIPEYVWKWISGGIVILLGLVTVFPSLWESQFLARISVRSNILLGKGDRKKSFWGDVIVGAALGPVFSTCSPTYFIVLATVLPVRPALGMLYLLAYTAGLSLSLLGVSIVGQKILDKLGIVADTKGWFKRTLGLVFIVVGIAIIGGLDKKAQLFLLDAGFFDVTKIEQKLLEKNSNKEGEQKQASYKKVPELSSIDGYVNTNGKQITLESLRGKVVLLDIWTYSCINCQRTIPHINDWYSKYKDQGLEVVGLHTPEFAFEKVQGNVEKAVKDFAIKYPVVLDNDYSTWDALGNQYWPRKYLIDIDGNIVYDHIGEGAYAETEMKIQELLAERAQTFGEQVSIQGDLRVVNKVPETVAQAKSPETYFGSLRNEYFANGRRGVSGEQVLEIAPLISPNRLYLSGTWNITPEHALSVSNASVFYKYNAREVYLVAEADSPVAVEIIQDGIATTKVIQESKLYTIISNSEPGEHMFEIKIQNNAVRLYALTFG